MTRDGAIANQAARLRSLLVALLIAGVALVALGAVSHSHAHVHSHNHAAIATTSLSAPDDIVDEGGQPFHRAVVEADGLCLAVMVVALVLLTLIQAVLARRPLPGLPVSAPSAPRPVDARVRQPAATPDLTELAICRQ